MIIIVIFWNIILTWWLYALTKELFDHAKYLNKLKALKEKP